MKIQTFSIVVGTQACNARCPFCVSKMTGFEELPETPVINERNFKKACMLADKGGTTTVLITGKGEPTLFKTEIFKYLRLLEKQNFPFIELQTNGLEIGWLAGGKRRGNLSKYTLEEWYYRGLDTIALSIVSTKLEENAEVYHRDYPDLCRTIEYLHEFGFSVRLCLMMQRNYVSTIEDLLKVVDFCRDNGVEQLTARGIRASYKHKDTNTYKYVLENGIPIAEIDRIRAQMHNRGKMIMRLDQGAEVFDVGGQNLCMTDCLTVPTDENLRSLIFYSNGRITYDWQYPGAVLLGGIG